MISTASLLLAGALLVHPSVTRCRLGIKAPVWLPGTPWRAATAGSVALVVLVVVSMPLTVSLSTAALAGTLVYRRRRRTAQRVAMDEGRALTSALEMLTAELRAGAHPVRAFEVAATETSGPVGAGLRTVAARAGLGADVPAGLRAAGRGSRLAGHWERLAACWGLAAQHGLPIGVLMRTAALDIAERQRYCVQVDAGLAGARATAAILAALPVVGVLLGELLGASPAMFLTRGAGGVVLLAGVVLLCAGVLWAGRITDRLPS